MNNYNCNQVIIRGDKYLDCKIRKIVELIILKYLVLSLINKEEEDGKFN